MLTDTLSPLSPLSQSEDLEIPLSDWTHQYVKPVMRLQIVLQEKRDQSGV